jgi:hypothetical protein
MKILQLERGRPEDIHTNRAQSLCKIQPFGLQFRFVHLRLSEPVKAMAHPTPAEIKQHGSLSRSLPLRLLAVLAD